MGVGAVCAKFLFSVLPNGNHVISTVCGGLAINVQDAPGGSQCSGISGNASNDPKIISVLRRSCPDNDSLPCSYSRKSCEECRWGRWLWDEVEVVKVKLSRSR